MGVEEVMRQQVLYVKYRYPGMQILWKGTISADFRAIRLKLYGRYAFLQDFHTRNLCEISVFYVMWS